MAADTGVKEPRGATKDVSRMKNRGRAMEDNQGDDAPVL